jgi:hypothetical protein
LFSETNPKILIEEENHFYRFREVYSISSMKDYLYTINQRRLNVEELKCDIQAFQNDSAVCERCPAAETVV